MAIKPMTSKARVHAALNRQPVDRVPIFMWFHPITANRLAAHLEIPVACVAEAMGDDVRQAWVGNNYAMEGITHARDGDSHVDAWGIEWVKEGPFNQIRRSPLQDADEAAIGRYVYPDAHLDALMANMQPVVRQAAEAFIGCDVSPCAFEMVCRLRGMEQAALDLGAAPELAARMLADAAGFAERLAQAACARFPLDWLWTGDDIAGQQSMIMSPACWRAMIRPHMARIFNVGKARRLWVAYHSCGAIRPIIPDLIEMGLDVLNPIQCRCPGMDPFELKREFGSKLAFMGGIDTQEMLPRSPADEVRRATERLVEGMTSDGGGFILAASHTVPPETPMANILAMYAAAGVSREEIFDRAATIRARRQ
jgi:uroporphyrinogen decarboxylase